MAFWELVLDENKAIVLQFFGDRAKDIPTGIVYGKVTGVGFGKTKTQLRVGCVWIFCVLQMVFEEMQRKSQIISSDFIGFIALDFSLLFMHIW